MTELAPPRAWRLLPSGGYAGRAHVLLERSATVSRRSWLVFVSGFFEPVFYLLSIGVGVGALVGTVAGADGRAIDYAAYVAPGLLASSAMNGAIYDSTLNVFFKLKYARTYDTMLTTPLGPREVALGEITWAQLRGTLYSATFLLVMLVLGLLGSATAVLALPAAMLVGLAFGAVGMAVTSFMRTWQDFEFVQLAVLPMFLFSTTFYPLSVYPGPLRTAIQLTPLYHGIELIRPLATGVGIGIGLLGHVLYLVAMAAAGLALTGHRLRHLLLR